MELFLPVRAPFSLSSVITSHGWVQLRPFEKDAETGGLRYVDRLSSGRVLALNIREMAERVRLETDVLLTPSEQDELLSHARWMLGVEQDFSAFYALIRGEPKLARVEARAQGRLLHSPTLFEDVVKTILTTNTTWSGTIRMVAALVAQYGEPLPSDPARQAFPTPEQLASADVDSLRATVKLGYRAPYLLELAQAVASGTLDLEALRAGDLPTPELRKRLLALKGVGSYAAAHLLMLLGRYNFVPVDSWALTMVSREWHAGASIGPAEVEAAFARWGEWRGLVYWFWDWDNAG